VGLLLFGRFKDAAHVTTTAKKGIL